MVEGGGLRVTGHQEQLGEAFDAVLAGARAGAPWAFERLYHHLAPAVTGYARLQGVPDPDDVASEVFLGVFRGIGGFAGDEDSFRSWVFRIAHRRIVDDRRRRARRPVDLVEDPPDGPEPDHHNDPADLALRNLASERVLRLCDQLVPDQRAVLLLRLVGDLTVDQVADALDKSPGAVKQLQRRGLGAIKRLLAREGVSHQR